MKHHFTMDEMAQTAHVGLGAWFMYLPHGWGWKHPFWLGLLYGSIWVIFKEAFWDPRHEDKETAGSGWRDAMFWFIGMGIGRILLL